jgi:O-antigen ligase
MVWALIGYMFLFIDRPFEAYPVLGDFRLERCYMLLTLALFVAHPRKRWIPNPLHTAYACLALSVLLAWAASPWSDKGQPVVEDWFKIVVFYVLLVSVVHDEKTLRQVVLAFLVVMAAYMLHSLREYAGGRHVYRMGIARLVGVDTTQGDPNSFGASVVFALPFVVPFWRDRPTKLMKAFLVGYVLMSILCVGLTGSRSSLIGLVAAGLLMCWQSRYRWRWLVGAAVIAPLMFLALPDFLQERFETLVNPEAGPKVAYDSGYSRLEGLIVGFQLWTDNPITGVGPGVWRPATGRMLESHNLYGQIMGELGTLGVAAFAAVLACVWLNGRAVARVYRRHPEWGRDWLRDVVTAVQLGVLLMLLEGNFGHNLFRHNWLWYGGFLIVARYCVRRRTAGAAPEPVRAPRPAFPPVAWPGAGLRPAG